MGNDRFSLSEAASYVGISRQHLYNLYKNGKIAGEERIVGKQKRLFFEKGDLNALREQLDEPIHPSGKKLTLYHNHLRLFETLKIDGETVRILNTDPLHLRSIWGKEYSKIPFPYFSLPLVELPYIRTKGSVDFIFPIPASIEHPLYDLMYRVIESLGEKNVQIYKQVDSTYFLRCRSGSIEGSAEEYELLKRGLRRGNILYDNGYIRFEGNYVRVQIHISNDLLNQIQQIKNLEYLSLNDKIIELIKRGIIKSRAEQADLENT